MAVENTQVSRPAAKGDAPYYILPDTLRNWPWVRIISPHYRAAQAESVAWLESFKPFSPNAQRAFNACDFSLVSSLCFPESTHDILRSCCDLMHTFFTLDEYTDVLDMERTAEMCEITMDAINNPDKPRPEGECIIGEITRQFWQRAATHALPQVQDRFRRSWRLYIDSVIQQADRRDKSYTPTMDEYLEARRDNIGSDPSMCFLEMSLGIDIPEEVMSHPAIVSLQRDTTDMIILANDMCSYKKEVLADDVAYNAVTIVMKNYGTDIAGGIQWISDYHDEIVDHFLCLREDVRTHKASPSWGERLDREVELYINGLGQWIRGHDEWNFGSGRYFGTKGLEIQQTRRVVIV